MELTREFIEEGIKFINGIRGNNMFKGEIRLVVEYVFHCNLTVKQYIYNVNNAVCLEKGYINISHLINPIKETENNKTKIVWQKNKYNGIKGKSKDFEFGNELSKIMEVY